MPTIDEIILPPPDAGEVFDPARAFGRDAPFELEIGSGKGGFLLRRAKERPDIDLLGIEYANKFFKYAADRMARWGVPNVRMMRTDARNFVIHHLPARCLTALHIYHPDPWPKKRHHKRRLFQPDFVAAAVRALCPAGRLAIQTDHADYYAWITEMLSAAEGLEPTDYDDASFGIIEDSAQTNFEIKYRREGREIHRLAYRKVE
jgi:tRNA (guanine-N7-)-methyltransferase